MALTERYVTVTGAGAHDGTTEANAWTFAEMIAAAPAAGTRVNIKSGDYGSVGVTTLPGGAFPDPVVYRGYNSMIGDLDGQGRGPTGYLNTTNYPDFNLTGIWTVSAVSILQNLDITGALSSHLVGGSASDNYGYVNCRIVNTQNNSSARAIQGDDVVFAINCDFECTRAAHASVVDFDEVATVIGCTIKGVADVACLSLNSGCVIDSLLWNTNGVGIGVRYITLTAYRNNMVCNCTIYDVDEAIQTPDAAQPSFLYAINNHVTDSGKFLDNLYALTDEHAIVQMWNRTRDNGADSGILDAVKSGHVITDTGDYSTDFVDAENGDFRLIASAPAVNAGMVPYRDIGAWQRVRDYPAVANVLTTDTVDGAAGTFDEAARNTDPGEENVEDGVTYKIQNVDKEGTLVAGGGGGGMPIMAGSVVR